MTTNIFLNGTIKMSGLTPLHRTQTIFYEDNGANAPKPLILNIKNNKEIRKTKRQSPDIFVTERTERKGAEP